MKRRLALMIISTLAITVAAAHAETPSTPFVEFASLGRGDSAALIESASGEVHVTSITITITGSEQQVFIKIDGNTVLAFAGGAQTTTQWTADCGAPIPVLAGQTVEAEASGSSGTAQVSVSGYR